MKESAPTPWEYLGLTFLCAPGIVIAYQIARMVWKSFELKRNIT